MHAFYPARDMGDMVKILLKLQFFSLPSDTAGSNEYFQHFLFLCYDFNIYSFLFTVSMLVCINFGQVKLVMLYH